VIAIYVRVSTEDQLKGYSVEGQIEDCKRLIKTNEYLEYIDDGYTGEILNRPALMKLQDDIGKGLITKVVCYDPDRLSRKLLVQLMIAEQFQKHNVELQFVKHDYKDDAEGQLFFQVRGAFSEFDKAKIKHNTMTGRYRKAKKGLVVKNGNLYGYDFDKKNNTYTINENEAKFIRMIFDYYTNPSSAFQGINGIANHLTDIGAPTKRGAKVWHRQVVRQILMNEAYTGNYYQNRHDTVGNYVKKQSGEKVDYGKLRPKEEWLLTEIPPIITEEHFEYAQQLLEQGRRRHSNFGKHNYLLSGLVRCGRCGSTMTGRKTKSHGKDFYIYECRKNYAGSKTSGCGRQISENKLNKYVWEQLVEIFNDPSRMDQFSEETENTYIQDELKHLEEEIEKTKKGRKRLFQLVSLSEDDDMDLEEIKDQIRDLQIKEKNLQNKYNQIKDELKAGQKSEPNEMAFMKAVEYYLTKNSDNLPLDDKQVIIRMCVREIILIDSETVQINIF
jgi:site-specific DNA recombinase